MTSATTPYGVSLLWTDPLDRRAATAEETYYTADLNLDLFGLARFFAFWQGG